MATQRKALVTLVIGEAFQKNFQRFFRASWDRYAARHGYDIVTIDQPIDPTPRYADRTPHWQKCLILEHPEVRRYDRVAWVDADILINHHSAPCIFAGVPEDSIGLVCYSSIYGTGAQLDNRYHRHFRFVMDEIRAERGPAVPDIYKRAGLPGDLTDFSNTGVLVLRPESDAAILRAVYDGYGENEASSKENVPLSYHLHKHARIHQLDPRFNNDWSGELICNYPFLMTPSNAANHELRAMCVNTAWHNSFFLHFIGNRTRQDVAYVSVDYDGSKLHPAKTG